MTPSLGALASARIETPVGPVLAVASDAGLCGLPFLPDAAWLSRGAKGRDQFSRRLQRFFGNAELGDQPHHAIIVHTQMWLAAYFGGAELEKPPLDLRGQAFERRVWQALLDVPAGQTASYGEIARRIGQAGASRAVGLANGANPVPIVVPCHRIIGASGTLTGYGGGLARKAWLLTHERHSWGANRSLIGVWTRETCATR